MLKVQSSLKEMLLAKLTIVQAGVDFFTNYLREDIKKEDEYTVAAIEAYLSILERGGKRMRGVLAVVGYEAYGGSNQILIGRAAGVIEGYHSALLVSDDISDNSELRRGDKTAHIILRDYLTAHHAPGSATKLGIDMAQTAATYAQHSAQLVLLNLDLPPVIKIRAGQVVNTTLMQTGLGQLRDISPIDWDKLDPEDILRRALDKTAHYSFALPLKVGAILAGAPLDELDYIDTFAYPAGLAFQIRDDIIGLFGDEQVTGKPRKSDVMEGKKTMIMSETLKRARPEEREALERALGNPELTDADFENCLKIIKRTGALSLSEQRIEDYTKDALNILDNAPIDWSVSSLQFLKALTLQAASREN